MLDTDYVSARSSKPAQMSIVILPVTGDESSSVVLPYCLSVSLLSSYVSATLNVTALLFIFSSRQEVWEKIEPVRLSDRVDMNGGARDSYPFGSKSFAKTHFAR